MFEPILKEKQRRLDVLQLIAVAGLMVVGALFVYSATMVDEASASESWVGQAWFRQIIWYALGVAAAAIVCIVDYRSFSRFAYLIYWGMILMLVAVLIPGVGSIRYGARRWLDLGIFQFQPSEFAKLAVIIVLAHFLSRPAEELRQPRKFFNALGFLMLPFVLIMKEPDLGSALLLLPSGMMMLFVAGTPPKYLVRLLCIVGVLGGLFLADVLFAPTNWQVMLGDYQRSRLLVYFGVQEQAPAGATRAQQDAIKQQQRDHSHNVRQALISVGSGGLTGKGWMDGTQNALGYLPRAVAHNDFIFSVIAEEEGFTGSVVVIMLYGVVLLTGIRIAGQARDRLGKLLAVGVVTLLFSHVFINIGMNIRLMPVTGVPLPLLSYGGSSVLCSLIAIGILQNVYMYRKSY